MTRGMRMGQGHYHSSDIWHKHSLGLLKEHLSGLVGRSEEITYIQLSFINALCIKISTYSTEVSQPACVHALKIQAEHLRFLQILHATEMWDKNG